MYLFLRFFGRSITFAVGRHPNRVFTDGVHVYAARTLSIAQSLAMEGVYMDWREVWNKEWRAVGDFEMLRVGDGRVSAADWSRTTGEIAVLLDGAKFL